MAAVTLFVVEACMVPVYVVIALPSSLVGLAYLLAVIRANKDDLPDIVRGIGGTGQPRDDDDDDDDSGKTPPSLPKP